ncbi:MAG TPA: fibronectin type III domain-containing protein [Gemmatimonadales bacterium]|jgi:hypothetical protein
MIRSNWMCGLLALLASPLSAQVSAEAARIEQPQAAMPTATRSRASLERVVVNTSIGVRGVFPTGGEAIDIFFDAVDGATTYTLRRASSSNGPYTTLPPSQARLTTHNYVANPPCCEIMDMEAYKVGVGQTVWYMVDAWSGTTLIKSTAPIRMDLPSWFTGPLRVDVAKTGNDQWTIGWEPVVGATSYLVWVRINGGQINTLYNPNVPASQRQLTLSGLYPGTQYLVYVSGSVTWNGMKLGRSGSIWYTAP